LIFAAKENGVIGVIVIAVVVAFYVALNKATL